MKNLLKDVALITAALLLTGGAAHAMQPPDVANPVVEHSSKNISNKNPDTLIEPVQQAETPEPEQPAVEVEKPVVEAPVKPEQGVSLNVTPVDNETAIWNFLIEQGFTRNQTAGIMGNLQQEHNFQTSDSPGGLGIAQWIGGRRARLIQQGDYTNLNVQLNFLMSELSGAEAAAGNALRAAESVEGATQAFQNKFERCGKCMESKRIAYAYAILNRH